MKKDEVSLIGKAFRSSHTGQEMLADSDDVFFLEDETRIWKNS